MSGKKLNLVKISEESGRLILIPPIFSGKLKQAFGDEEFERTPEFDLKVERSNLLLTVGEKKDVQIIVYRGLETQTMLGSIRLKPNCFNESSLEIAIRTISQAQLEALKNEYPGKSAIKSANRRDPDLFSRSLSNKIIKVPIISSSDARALFCAQYYLKGLTLAEIAQELNISRERVRRLIERGTNWSVEELHAQREEAIAQEIQNLRLMGLSRTEISIIANKSYGYIARAWAIKPH